VTITSRWTLFLKCAPDPRGKGFGPNASADITCAK